MKLLFASTNAGKKKELKSILKLDNLEIILLDDLEVDYQDVEETGSTFRENAELKAEYFAELTNLPTLADDTGLMVSALDGAPGVNSNRWHPGSDTDRNQALLERLSEAEDRSAKFVTVACYYNPNNNIIEFFRGEIAGKIAGEPSGRDGFGYDPIFIPKGHQQTFAALGVAEKNQLSHRAKAYQKFANYLEQQQ